MEIRNLKAFGLALVAVFAMSAIAASASQAENAQLTYGAGATTVDGEQIEGVHTFVSNGRTVECEVAKFSGPKGATSTTLTVTPTYEKCKVTSALGTFPATVKFGECDYLFHATKVSGVYEADADLLCKSGSVKVSIYNNVGHTEELCSLTISQQLNLNTITLQNKGENPDHVRASIAVTGIVVAVDGSTVICGKANSAATYSGTAMLEATNAAEEVVDLTVSDD